MTLPKPLLLVLVLLIVLAVGGLAGGLLGGRDGDGGGPDADVSDSLAADIGRLLDGNGLLPGTPPVVLTSGDTDCLSAGALEPAAGGCLVIIPATDAERRRLRLRLRAGDTVRVDIAQRVDGELHTADPTTVPFTDHGRTVRDVDVTVRRGDSAVIGLACVPAASCRLEVNPDG